MWTEWITPNTGGKKCNDGQNHLGMDKSTLGCIKLECHFQCAEDILSIDLNVQYILYLQGIEYRVCIPQPREWGPWGLLLSPNPGYWYGIPILMGLTNIGQFPRLI